MTKRKPPEAHTPEDYRTITIEVREDVARRLEKSAERYSRYQNEADVAAECVHLYLDLLEEADEAADDYKDRQIRNQLRSTTKATAPTARRKPDREKIQKKASAGGGL